ncbi:hypothetical protein JHK87_045243 [Glycine soja]|nr:hypothetical protein JHK87_045243 [Glycine soja]
MLQLTDEVLSLKILVCFTPRDITSIGSICRDCVWCKYTWIRSAGKKVNYSSSSSLEETGCWSGFEPSHFDFSACALAITGVNIAEQFALYHGLKVAGDKGIRSLICESDSKMALQLIQHNDNAFHPHALLIRKIQSYKNWQWEVQLSPLVFVDAIGGRSDSPMMVNSASFCNPDNVNRIE